MTKKQNIILYSVFALFIVCEIFNFFFLPVFTAANSWGEYNTATLFRLLQVKGERIWILSNCSIGGVKWYPYLYPYLLFIFAMTVGIVKGKK